MLFCKLLQVTIASLKKLEIVHLFIVHVIHFKNVFFGLNPKGDKILFTKGAESAILPFATGGEIDKTRLHVDEFALVRRF